MTLTVRPFYLRLLHPLDIFIGSLSVETYLTDYPMGLTIH